MTVLTQTSGRFLIDQHVIELEPGQVVSYRDDKEFHSYPSFNALLDGLKARYPQKYAEWKANIRNDIDGEVYTLPDNFLVQFRVIERPQNRIVIRFRASDINNCQALVLNTNGVLALAEVSDGNQKVVFSQAGAVTYGDKVQLHVSGAVRVGVNGEVVGSHNYSTVPGNLARIDLDGAVITDFSYRKL